MTLTTDKCPRQVYRIIITTTSNARAPQNKCANKGLSTLPASCASQTRPMHQYHSIASPPRLRDEIVPTIATPAELSLTRLARAGANTAELVLLIKILTDLSDQMPVQPAYNYTKSHTQCEFPPKSIFAA